MMELCFIRDEQIHRQQDIYLKSNTSNQGLCYQLMNSGSKSQRKYAQKVQRPSKVLLICVYDTVVIDITNDIIKSKFEEFGKITKMLIFEKGEVTKLFLEYEQLDQAIKAKNKLDGTKLYEAICKMTIYFSNFSNVEVVSDPIQNSYQSTQEYSSSSEKKMARTQEENLNWVQAQRKLVFSMDIGDDQIMQSFDIFGQMKRSKTDNTPNLQWEIQKSNQNSVRYEQKAPQEVKLVKNEISWTAKKQEQKSIKMKEDTDVRSSILWFSYRYQLKPKHIYNLFSNFGNISSITVKKQMVFIKFRSKEFAAMASTYLNNTVLMGNIMQLRECPQESACWKLTQGEFSESVYYDLNYDRFTPQRSITINPPANTIHVSSIKRQICRQKSLDDIFDKYGRIQKIQILQNSADKNMALIKFQTLQDSFNAIANLHNQFFSGRKMQISFTKSKL